MRPTVLVVNLAILGFSLILIQAKPTNEKNDESNEGQNNGNTHLGQQALDKFDKIFYGLIDEALQYVTEDKKGAFKDMAIRHRGDLVQNLKENLVQNDNITLNHVSSVVQRELKNRLELFNYVGEGVWKQINSASKNLLTKYKSYCDENSASFFCLSNSDTNNRKSSTNYDQLEREDS